MAKLLSESDFIEVDVTYKASVELEYLLNVVSFDYTTLKCEFIPLSSCYFCNVFPLLHYIHCSLLCQQLLFAGNNNC